jgi:hypothetical protein
MEPSIPCTWSDIVNTIPGNEGYPSEGVAVFGLHGVRRVWTAERRGPTDTVWWLWHLVPYILHGSAAGLRSARELEMQMVTVAGKLVDAWLDACVWKYSGPSSYDRLDIQTTWVMTKNLILTYDQSLELRPTCRSRPLDLQPAWRS